MTVRIATESDKAAVIGLLRASRLGAGFDTNAGLTGFVFPFDAAYAERLFLMHLRAPQALCLVSVPDTAAKGVLMATAAEHPFGPVRLARETVWWIDPAHRGSAAVRMLDAYEAWAFGDQGCAYAGMAGMGADPTVARLYERRGYRIAETHYLKAA